jgi:hypothetical protein
MPGGNYLLSVTERDIAGDTSVPATSFLVVPLDNSAFRMQGNWSRVIAGNDFGGSDVQTASKNASAKITARGRRYVLLARVGPTSGKLAIFHGKTKVQTVDLFNASAGHRLIDFFGSSSTPRRVRTFTFVCTGKHGPFTNKSVVSIDGLDVIS